jgi:hypothetical protein
MIATDDIANDPSILSAEFDANHRVHTTIITTLKSEGVMQTNHPDLDPFRKHRFFPNHRDSVGSIQGLQSEAHAQTTSDDQDSVSGMLAQAFVEDPRYIAQEEAQFWQK